MLKQKVARYLAYADALVWQDQYPYCPPMLLLTTTATRAASFTRVAGQIAAAHRQRVDEDDRAALLVTAACGHVRDPARAIAEPCWAVPDTAVADLTLAEILRERAEAAAASDAWLYDRDVVQRCRNDIEALREITRFTKLGDWLGSDAAGEVLPVLIGTDPEVFLDNEPDLSRQVIDWLDRRRRLNRFQSRDLAAPLVAVLEPHREAVWRAQAQRLLAARDDIADEHPRVCRLTATLAAGRLVAAAAIAVLDHPPEQTRAEIQQAILGDYHARRTAGVDQQWSALGWRDRRRITREQIEADYDERNLCICDTCTLVYPLPPDGESLGGRCTHCDGIMLDWPDRSSILTLPQTLATIGQWRNDNRAQLGANQHVPGGSQTIGATQPLASTSSLPPAARKRAVLHWRPNSRLLDATHRRGGCWL